MAAPIDISVGTIVDIPLGRGVVRFFGPTSFSAGKWVGIELSQPVGKNDGSVKGVPYFTCQPNYGVFVKPSQVKIVQDLQSSGNVSTPLYFLTIIDHVDLPQPSSQPVARPSLGHSRTPSTGPSRAPSSRSIPPPSPRATSPSKAGVGQSTRVSARLAPPSPTKRSPIPTTPQHGALKRIALTPGRPSMGESSISGSSAPSRGDSPDSVPPARTLQLRKVSSPIQQPRDRLIPGIAQASTATPAPSSHSPPPSLPPESKEPVSGTSNPSSVSTAEKSGLNDEELQELRAKIRVLEIKRADDARHVKELETKLSEAETFVALRPKLQAKLVQQQTELIEARRELADVRQLSELAETRNLDTLEQLEMAMLDREVAEERAEAAQTELEELKEKLAVVEVELDVIKEGACECALAYFKVAKLMCLKLRKAAAQMWPALWLISS